MSDCFLLTGKVTNRNVSMMNDSDILSAYFTDKITKEKEYDMEDEVIFELAGEAEDYAFDVEESGGDFHYAYTRKLSELIVMEALSFVKSDDEAQAILDHFGFNGDV